jgi:hypothetical protein
LNNKYNLKSYSRPRSQKMQHLELNHDLKKGSGEFFFDSEGTGRGKGLTGVEARGWASRETWKASGRRRRRWPERELGDWAGSLAVEEEGRVVDWWCLWWGSGEMREIVVSTCAVGPVGGGFGSDGREKNELLTAVKWMWGGKCPIG